MIMLPLPYFEKDAAQIQRSCASKTNFRYYHQTSSINRTLQGNKIVDHSDVVGAAPVHSRINTWLEWIE